MTVASLHRVQRTVTTWSDNTIVFVLALSVRLAALGLLSTLSFLPLFDSSPEILAGSSRPPVTLRWDALHFVGIASDGYRYEQQIAFQPGWQGCLRLGGKLVARLCKGQSALMGVRDVVFAGQALAMLCFALAAVALFRLTSLTHSRPFAWTTVGLYLLAPTPAVLSSAYTEPLFALLTMTGFLMAVRGRHTLAAVTLAAASSVRSTGVFSAGVLGWLILFPPTTALRGTWTQRFVKAGVLAAVVVLPFIAFQAYGFFSFCSGSGPGTRPWCDATLPVPYSFVQAEYWNVGFLRYWTAEQIPNLAIAMPVVVPSIAGSLSFLSRAHTNLSGGQLSRQDRALVPLHLHHLGMTALLILSSHTQIALRVISGDPVLWWNVVDMAFDWHRAGDSGGRMTRLGRWWVWWSVLWGAASLVLWAGFYPPA